MLLVIAAAYSATVVLLHKKWKVWYVFRAGAFRASYVRWKFAVITGITENPTHMTSYKVSAVFM